jgi:hypothetical protein
MLDDDLGEEGHDVPDFPGRDPGRGAKLVRGISVPAGLRLLKKVDGITRRLSVFAA